MQLKRGGQLLFVSVRINGKDAGIFVLDTGAGHTVVDTKVADRLNLPTIGQATVRTPSALRVPRDTKATSHRR